MDFMIKYPIIFIILLWCYCETFQEDYVSEGITWQSIDYSDNTGCIQLISEETTGFFDLLDQESKWVIGL